MKILVTGTQGQLATSMRERADGETVVCVGRPDVDFSNPETIERAILAEKPHVVVNAAAYTAVDQAEKEPELAMAVNGAAAGAVAAAAARLGLPVIHISTDYVFDGGATVRTARTIRLPLWRLWREQAQGRGAGARPPTALRRLRTAWVYSPFGKNFVRTMLRLAEARDEIGVVADQIGSPTNALSLADTVIAVARNLLRRPDDPALYGVFHAVDGGEASWAEFAGAIFARSLALGGPSARVRPIATSEYPTPTARPANSRLSTAKLQRIHGVAPRDWRGELNPCVDRLVGQGA